jgi:hypothetical protein
VHPAAPGCALTRSSATPARTRAADAEVQQLRVPAAVFGSAAGLGEKRGAEEEPMGALERFKRKK